MGFPTVFATLPGGNQPASLLDGNFNACGALGVITCSASGTNSIALTTLANTPPYPAYVDLAPKFSFIAAATCTAPPTLNINGLGARGCVKHNNTQVTAAGDLVGGGMYVATPFQALFSGAGGFVVDSIVPQQMLGTQTNDSANAGNIGEAIEADVPLGSAIGLTTGVSKNICSITLPPGDWDVSAVAYFVPAATTGTLNVIGALSGATNTLDQTIGRWNTVTYQAGAVNIQQTIGVCISSVRFPISAPTNLFWVAFASFITSTMTVYGHQMARRRR